MPTKSLFVVLISLIVFKSNAQFVEVKYFPPVHDNAWETINLNELGWNATAANELTDYLKKHRTKAFIVLFDGKIVIEEYFNGHKPTDNWEWNSAGKTLVGTTIGIAQMENKLQIHDEVLKYLGSDWANMSQQKMKLINILHLLTMTSGIQTNKQLMIKRNITYVADAGTVWSYGNVFQKLRSVIGVATGIKFNDYFNLKLKEPIGMNGYWKNGLIFDIYHSDARSMARFGLLVLNGGKWMDNVVVDKEFLFESVNSSQALNPAYGYFWWLNGKSSYILPGSKESHNAQLIPNAPKDMYAAMGAADQRLYIVPSKKLVIVRMGKPGNPQHPHFALSGFDKELWQKINAMIPADWNPKDF